jgi:hypothetical protein
MNTFDVVEPKGYGESQMAYKRLAEILRKLDQEERKNKAVANFDLPAASKSLNSGAGPQPVPIRFFKSAFPDGQGQSGLEMLREKLRGYFPMEFVRDVTIDGESIYAET